MNTHAPNPYVLPPGLPVPQDDGACAQLAGRAVPELSLLSSEGLPWSLALIAQNRAVVYLYPATGVPGQDPLPAWNEIPGAPGCTVQALGFRDHYAHFLGLGYPVFGISTQSTAEQAEFKQRTRLPLILLSDPRLLLRDRLGLPTFETQGRIFYKRTVLLLQAGVVQQVFYPVFPPDQCAASVLQWLTRSR